MDWSNERYVRLYTRDSVTWSLWAWEARALFCFLLRKVDRAGVIDIGSHSPERALAAIVGMPVAVVAEHLPALLDSGAIEIAGAAMVMPNYIEAQEAKSSDKQRQSESRARRRDRARTGHDTSPPVTRRDTSSQAVTRSHDASHSVTPSLAEPSQTTPSRSERQASPAKPATRTPKPQNPEAVEIAQYLYDAIRSHSPGFMADAPPAKTAKKLEGWAHDIDRAIRLDGMTPEGAREAIDAAHRSPDPFWRSNLLSGAKLRKHYETLRVRANPTPIRRKQAPDLSALDNFDFKAAAKIWGPQ